MADSYKNQEFVKCQATVLLGKLPEAARKSLRYYEVAALIGSFQPKPPLSGPVLAGKSFWYVVVTDWSLLIVSMAGKDETSVALELPLLCIRDMDQIKHDGDDYVNDTRGTVHSSSIRLYPTIDFSRMPVLMAASPKQQQQQQQQKQQGQHSWMPSALSQPTAAASALAQAPATKQAPSSSWLDKLVPWRRAGAAQPESQQNQPQAQAQEQQLPCATPFGTSVQAVQLPMQSPHFPGPIQTPQQLQQQQQQQQPQPVHVHHQQHWSQQDPWQSQVPSSNPYTTQHNQQHHIHQPWQPLVVAAAHQQPMPWQPQPQQQYYQPQQQQQHWQPQPLSAPVQQQPGPWQELHAPFGHAWPRPIGEAVESWAPPATPTGRQPGHAPGLVVDVDAGGSREPKKGLRSMRSLGRLAGLKVDFGDEEDADSGLLSRSRSLAEQQSPLDGPGCDAGHGDLQEDMPYEQTWGEQLLQQAHQAQQRMLSSYVLALLTVERYSNLYFQIQRAWVGAHMRMALTRANAPGLPIWLEPPSSMFITQPKRPAGLLHKLAKANKHQGHGSSAHEQHHQRHLQSPEHSPRHGHNSRAAAASLEGLVTAMDSEASDASGASLQQNLLRFFGLASGPNSSPLANVHQHGLFPGDGPLWSRQPISPRRQLAEAAARQQSSSVFRATDTDVDGPVAANARPGKGVVWEDEHITGEPIRSPTKLADGSEQMPDTACSSRLTTPVPGFDMQHSSLSALTMEYERLMQRHAMRKQSVPHLNHIGPPGIAGMPNHRGHLINSQQRSTLRGLVQASKSAYMQHYAFEAREVFWDLSELLIKPCSLFDSRDTSNIKDLVLELAFTRADKATELHKLFFSSQRAMAFLVARILGWGALCGLFHDDLPPIKNPALPGMIDQQAGKRVVWSTAMLYQGRPRKLLRRLGMLGSSPVSISLTMEGIAYIANCHRSGQASELRAHNRSAPILPLHFTYYADPLSLSPLADLPYHFLSERRRMVEPDMQTGLSRYAINDGEENDPSTSGTDDTSAGSLMEATVVLRWERLFGKLCARLAQRKLQLLLHWLQTQMAYTEGCTDRAHWLSDQLVDADPTSRGFSTEWTFRSCTRQLLAALLQLRLPGAAAFECAAPAGTQDMLWWAQGGAGGWALDPVVGVLYEAKGIWEQAVDLGQQSRGSDDLLEVVKQMPKDSLSPLLRRLFLRLICLMGGTASSREWKEVPAGVAAVLAFKYGSVLLDILEGVRGACDGLYDDFIVEVTHLMSTPQVKRMLASSEQGAGDEVLASCNRALLDCILEDVTAAVPWERYHLHDRRVSMPNMLGRGSVMKVQN